MSNPSKISTYYAPGYNLYALLHRVSDGYIWDVGSSAFEAVGTWNDARVGECDIVLTGNNAGLYTATFPSVDDNVIYAVSIHLRAGANPDTTDAYLGSQSVNEGGGASLVRGAGYIGDYKEDATLYFKWDTLVAPSTVGTVRCYKKDSTTEVTPTTGITDTRAFDGLAGHHLCKIDLSVNTFYEKEADYAVVLAGVVINDQTVNVTIATFSIENRYQGIVFEKEK